MKTNTINKSVSEKGFIIGTLLLGTGLSHITLAQDAPPSIIEIETGNPLEFRQLNFNDQLTDLNCAIETFDVEPLSGNPDPVWFNSAGGGFQLNTFNLSFLQDGTYQSSLGTSNAQFVESGAWSLVDGQLTFSCPASGCQLTGSDGTDEVSTVPFDFAVPTLSPFAVEVASPFGDGSDIAFYSTQDSRLRCSVVPTTAASLTSLSENNENTTTPTDGGDGTDNGVDTDNGGDTVAGGQTDNGGDTDNGTGSENESTLETETGSSSGGGGLVSFFTLLLSMSLLPLRRRRNTPGATVSN